MGLKQKRAAAQLSPAPAHSSSRCSGPSVLPEGGSRVSLLPSSGPAPRELLPHQHPEQPELLSAALAPAPRGATAGKRGPEHYPDLTRHSWVLQTSRRRIERKGSLSCRDRGDNAGLGWPLGLPALGCASRRAPALARPRPRPAPGSSRSQARAAHLLTLVVTDGKFIQNEVPPLPALPLEERAGNRSVLGSGALPTLSWSSTQSTPGASRTHRAVASPSCPTARSTGVPGTHHVPLLHAVAALEDGGPGGQLGGRGGDVALRAPQERVGGHVAALPSVPAVLQPESTELRGSRGRAGRGIPCRKAGHLSWREKQPEASPENSTACQVPTATPGHEQGNEPASRADFSHCMKLSRWLPEYYAPFWHPRAKKQR